MPNIHPQNFSIRRSDREQRAGHPGRVIWFTGLSGAGKSAIANALEIELYRRGRRTFILDGDTSTVQESVSALCILLQEVWTPSERNNPHRPVR